MRGKGGGNSIQNTCGKEIRVYIWVFGPCARTAVFIYYISKKCLSIILKGRPDGVGLGSTCLLDSMRYISERTESNADSTLDVSSADVSMYIMPFSMAKSAAIWAGTTRSAPRSDLFPTSMATTCGLACSRISSTQVLALLKDEDFVTSYSNNTPRAPR